VRYFDAPLGLSKARWGLLIINGLEHFDKFYSRYDGIVAAMGRSDMAEEKTTV
jgi:hypothetical protein